MRLTLNTYSNRTAYQHVKKGASRHSKKRLRGKSAIGFPATLISVLKKTATWLFGVAAVVIAVVGIAELRAIPVGEISIHGYSGSDHSNRGASIDELMAIVVPYQGKAYWGVNLHQLQSDLEGHPWVRQATIFRRWPNNIAIGIDEQFPIARWNSRHLLASSGDLVRVENATLFSSLPRFVTPEVVEEDQEMIRQMVDQYNGLQKILDSQQQKIIELGVSGANDIWLVVSSGTKIELGKKLQVMRLERLVSLIDRQLISGWEKIASADLRYEKGVSIGWADSMWEEELDSLVPLVHINFSGFPWVALESVQSKIVGGGLLYG